MGILYGYATGLAKQAKDEWQIEHGKNPNLEETKRIDMYSVVEAFLEKFEAIMVMRAFPIKNKAWTQGVLKKIKDKTPVEVLALPVFAGRFAAAGGSEYISGVGTTSASIMAKKGEITRLKPGQFSDERLSEFDPSPENIKKAKVSKARFNDWKF